MPNLRTYTDDQLRGAIAESSCWADVMEAIGKSRRQSAAYVRQVAERLGLDSSHFDVRRCDRPVQAGMSLPFRRQRTSSGSAPSLSVAMQWFLERGYLVSVPIEPAPYDLITESDQGLQRIQVKSSSMRPRGSGPFRVKLTHTAYVAGATRNSGGCYRQVPYEPGVIDYFFIATADEAKYLIPAHAVEGATCISLSERYDGFKVS